MQLSLEFSLSPAILVVVPTLGQRQDWLAASIRSILSQDGVDARVRVVGPRQAQLGPICSTLGVELIECDRKGLSVAINVGWQEADEFEFVTWLGDDDLLAPGSLAATAGLLSARPEISIVYGAVRYIDGGGNTLWVQRPGNFAGWYLRYGKNLVPQQGSLLRRSSVVAVGGLDESYKSAMDQDLFSRLIDIGKYAYIKKEVAAFRLHDSNITVTKGDTGTDEGEQIRSRHAGSLYPIARRLTRIADRVIYAIIRRWPYDAAPFVCGVPYTVNHAQNSDLDKPTTPSL